MRKSGLSDAIMAVLSVSDEPMTAYEVFELLPDVGVVYPSNVQNILKKYAMRGKIMRVAVNEKRGRHFVRFRYFLNSRGYNY